MDIQSQGGPEKPLAGGYRSFGTGLQIPQELGLWLKSPGKHLTHLDARPACRWTSPRSLQPVTRPGDAEMPTRPSPGLRSLMAALAPLTPQACTSPWRRDAPSRGEDLGLLPAAGARADPNHARSLRRPLSDSSPSRASPEQGAAKVAEERGNLWVPGGGRGAWFVYENKNMSSPKVYVLQPWIANLLVNYEQLDANENLLAGQVLRVLSDSTPPGQPGVLQDAVLQVSDGSYYIRVVITTEALRAEENTHMRLRLSSLICRIIVLQKYTVCFREEARLEDCEFYLTAQRFIVLPMERQRLDSSDGNQEPSVLQKIKELWLRSLALKNVPSSEPSISQLIDAIGQNQLEVLKESAEECLDLRVHKETLAAVKDEVPVTQWEAERKKERDEDVFTVPANNLVIPPEKAVVPGDAPKAGTSEATPGKSGDGRTVPSDPSVISQASSAESAALSESSEGSLDNPWNRLPAMSLTLNSSDEKTFQDDLSPKTQQDVAADSNTPDLLEPCSQDSPEGLPQGEPVQTSSPSLLHSYGSPSPAETGATGAASVAETACDAPSPARGPQVSGGSQATLPSLSPAFPVLPSTRLQALAEGMPHREQADSSGRAFPPDTLKRGLARARTQGGGAAGAKRKLLAGDGQALPALGGQQHPRGAPWGSGRDPGGRGGSSSTQSAKKSRKEETGLRRGKQLLEEEEEEQASPVSGSSSGPEQRRPLQPYVQERPFQYRYEAPSPELCEQIRSIRISKAMLKWACWILTDGEVDS
ncbi:adrenocortical dysplasia protein homolog [Opisthocomus hoazin]|uniref:adrenocortical dysplasia protein homolog n=1 Tax=Opisthocomus hoazin TaxID=30419 RepID=UPI003F529911